MPRTSDHDKADPPMRVFSKDGDGDDVPPAEEWETFRKVALTRMVRIDGPFTVQTSEGPLRCEDGWLAVDARGYYYPIAVDEQALIYARAAVAIHDPNSAPGRSGDDD